MSFNPGAGTFSGSADVALNGATDGQLIGYDNAAGKWTNRTPAITAINGLQAALDAKTPKFETLTTNPGISSLRQVNLNYALGTNNPDLEVINVNNFRASWRNEWGALRGTAPYSSGYGDALVRAIRENSDFITNSQAFEIVDRRTGAGNNIMWGRKWTDGNLVRNGNVMGDAFVIENGGTPPSNLPAGTVIIEKSSSSGGGTTVSPPMTDDFTGAFNTTKWPGSSGTLSNVSGRLRIPCTSSYANADSGAVFDLTQYPIWVEVPTVAANGNGTTDSIFRIYNSTGSSLVGFRINGSTNMFMEGTGLTNTSIAYSSISHRWLRMRISAGNLLWETSPDNANWTTRKTTAAPSWTLAGSLLAVLMSGYSGTESSPGYTEFDNFNRNITATNLSINPTADNNSTKDTTVYPNALSWTALRWFGPSGNGSYSYRSGQSDTPFTYVTNYIRKTWSTAPSSNGDTGLSHSGSSNTGYIVTAGETYTISSYIRPSSRKRVLMKVNFRNDSDASISDVAQSELTAPAGVWTSLSLTVTVPAGATRMKPNSDVSVNLTDSAVLWASGDTLDGTALLVQQGSTLGTYFDGVKPSGATYGYRWTGTAHQSTSEEFTL